MSTRRCLMMLGLPLAIGLLVTVGLGVALGGFSRDTDTKPVVYNTSQDATAKCPANQHVAFGGFKVDTTVSVGGQNGYTWPQSMGPKGSDTDKWSVAAENSGSAKDGQVSSYAYCQGGVEPKVVKKSQLVLPSAANDEFRSVEVVCPRSKNVIGGGWAAVTPQLSEQHTVDIMGLQRTSDHTWEVSVINDSGVQQKVTAIALCGKGKAPKTVTATEHIPNTPSTTKDAVATCPHGMEARFGGFKGDYDSLSGRNAFIFSFGLQGDDAIKVHGGQNDIYTNTMPSTLKAFAYCK